jgi:cell division protein FtsQ
VKRPEGVSAPTTRGAASPPPAVPTRKAPSGAQPVPTSAERRTTTEPVREPTLKREPRPRRSREPGSRPARSGPSRDRTARAEFKAAERARKRYERQEVKRFTRQSRRRRVTWGVAAGLVVSIAALVVTAVFSPLLALHTITIDGTSRLDTAKLQKAVDGQLGTPLALLDYGRITRELAPFSLIRSYVTEVVPPDGLVIHVVERTPVGAIQTASGFELVDPAGVVVDTSATRPDGYPLVQLGTGTMTGPGFTSMTQVLLALPASVLSKVDTITALTHDDVTLTLAGSSQRVVWGSSDGSDAKARVLAELVVLHGGSGAGEYDVSAPGTAVFHQG